jgi:hypothetical protein
MVGVFAERDRGSCRYITFFLQLIYDIFSKLVYANEIKRILERRSRMSIGVDINHKWVIGTNKHRLGISDS